MMGDFFKLVELLLPSSMRKVGVLALLRVLVSSPLQSLFAAYHMFRQRTKFEASVTPQACFLQYAIERTFDVNCEITELDGKPTDFLVSIDRSTDLLAIRGFVDKHKLAGRSYVFELGDTAYTATWLGYVDEDLITAYIVEWIGYVSEDDGVVNLKVTLSGSLAGGKLAISVAAEKAVKSDLTATVVIYTQPSPDFINELGRFDILIASGTSGTNILTDIDIDITQVMKIRATVTPSADGYYSYIIS